MKGWEKMKLSEMDNYDQVILEYIEEGEVLWDFYFAYDIRRCIEEIREEYENKFNVYRIKNEDIKLDAKEMIKCYTEKIQKKADNQLQGGYDVEELIIKYFTEQEYSALDYILNNTFAKSECKIYPVKGEEIEVDV